MEILYVTYLGELGLEEASNQLRSATSKASPATGLKGNVYSYKSPAGKCCCALLYSAYMYKYSMISLNVKEYGVFTLV